MQKSFIENQFPVSKISKESYKERKAVQGQTLTGLGKWWGRKPLILVRASIIAMLLPSSDDPAKDHDIFLAILSMDDDGLLARKNKSIPLKDLHNLATVTEKSKFFMNNGTVKWQSNISNEEKKQLQNKIFLRLSYDDKLKYCIRPEELDNLTPESWTKINSHLGTTAKNLQELTQQLSIKRYGKTITVGDCFCGGGSVPFEAARIGLHAYGSDLNPIAGLLTWAALNINGATDKEVIELRKFQKNVYDAIDKQVSAWGIEHNEKGDRANIYLYCNEVKCQSCGWRIPLISSCIVGRGSKTIATLKPNNTAKYFDIGIQSGVSSDELKAAEKGTVTAEGLNCPNCHTVSSMQTVRGDRKLQGGTILSGLRKWEKKDFIPRIDDVYQERLYCIRYEKPSGERYYRAPTVKDLEREQKVIELLSGIFADWQEKGYIPSDRIEPGDETSRLTRERGWQYWHQLFSPRDLLIKGSFMEKLFNSKAADTATTGLLGVNRMSDWSSKLCRWGAGQARESIANTFYNQALNTTVDYPSRGLSLYGGIWNIKINNSYMSELKQADIIDARQLNKQCQYWITDPPYADAVNYHELSEFFLAWDKKLLQKTFPEWYADSHRHQAVKGTGAGFNRAMVDVYKNLSNHMPDDGMQMVMFTHQSAAVWADLAAILWAAGLQVTAAWNVATETESGGLKSGNYVKGTVLMVLRKNKSTEKGWLSDMNHQIKEEVKNQIDSMRNLDMHDEPDFGDSDYMLAGYAAALKVLTSYGQVGDIDLEYEITRPRDNRARSPIQDIIEQTVSYVYELLIPKNISKNTWRDLIKEEKFYLKSLEIEQKGENKLGVYTELARGFGNIDYVPLLANTRANAARLKTATEFANKGISGNGFAGSLTRQVLMALHLASKKEDATAGRDWLKNELPTYWNDRTKIIEIFNMIIPMEFVSSAEHWHINAEYARYLKSLIENDGV